MKRLMISFLLTLLTFLTGHAGEKPVSKGSINVEVSGLRSNAGEMRVNLYDSKDGFPSEPQKAVMTLVTKIENNVAKVVFKDIPFGDYAISVLHDENGNKKMDLNWLMIPKEGIGASNNPKGSFGPPSFSDARFRLSSEELDIKITVRY